MTRGRLISRHCPAAVVLTFLVGMTVAGCTSADDQAAEGVGVGKDFAARALSVCASAQESKDAWTAFPAPDFDPSKPDVSDFPEVGAWLEDEVGPTFDAWLEDLTALGAPPTGGEAWTDALTSVGNIAHLNAVQVEAAKDGDADKFVDATNGLHEEQPELERATAAAGVAKCAKVHAG